MPNRILREGIIGSERMATLGWPEEVLYRRLMSVVDDYGRTEANPLLLRSRCYPLQTDKVRNTDISRWLAACQKAGLILVYETSGKQYLQLADFRQQTRTQSKFPGPPANATSLPADASNDVANAHLGGGGFGDVSGGEGGGDSPPSPQGGESESDDAFGRFWEAYPLKVGKGKARESFTRKKCALMLDALLAAVEAQKRSADWQKEGGRFIPHPSTWLNQERWTDEGRAPFSKRTRFDN